MPAEKPFRGLLWSVFLVYAAILLKLILFKRPFSYIITHFLYHYNSETIAINLKRANFIPFHTIQLYLHTKLRAEYSIENLFGNILIFVPLGFLIPLMFAHTRSSWKIFAVSLLTSLVLETTQLITVLGSFDVDDLMLNTTGGMIGYFAFKLLHVKSSAKKHPANSLT